MNVIKYLVLVLLFCCIVLIAANTNQANEKLTELSGDELLGAIKFFEDCYNIISDPNAPISTFNVIAAWEQYVSGTAYVYNGKLIDGNSTIRHCIIWIWDGLTKNIQLNCYNDDPNINVTF